MRKKLTLFASQAALSIDADLLRKIPLRMDGDKAPEYKVIFEQLEKIKEADPSVKYVYIMTMTDEPGILQYVVDANPLPEIITAKSPSSLPGDRYDAHQAPEMLEAYRKPTADRRLVADVWGITLSGYAPIYDKSGKTVAILGVDRDGTQMLASQKEANIPLIIVLVTAALSVAAFLLRI